MNVSIEKKATRVTGLTPAGWPNCYGSIISAPSITERHGLRSLKELVRSYLTITKDLGRVMSRVKAIYRSWAIACTGKQVYAPHIVPSGSGRSAKPGVRRRAEFYYQQLDELRTMRQQVRRELLAEGKKHQAWRRLCQIPSIRSDPVRRTAWHSADARTRFRHQRKLWTYRDWHSETPEQRRSPEYQRAVRTSEETDLHSRN